MNNIFDSERMVLIKTPLLVCDITQSRPIENIDIFLMNLDMNDTFDMMRFLGSTNSINSRHIKSYYIERRYNFKIENELFKDRIVKRKDIYDMISGCNPYIKKCYNQLSQYGKASKYIDLSYYINKFFKYMKEKEYTFKKKLKLFNLFFENVLSVYDINRKDDEDRRKVLLFNVTKFKLSEMDKLKDIPSIILFSLYRKIKGLCLAELNVDVIFYNDNGKKFIFNLKELFNDETSYNTLKILMRRLSLEEDEDESIDDIIDTKAALVSDKIMSLGFTGETNEKTRKVVEDKVKLAAKKTKKMDTGDIDEDSIDSEISNNPEVKKTVDKLLNNKIVKSSASLKRDKLLREKQGSIKVDDRTVDEIIANAQNNEIETLDLPITCVNDNMRTIENAVPMFNRAYNSKIRDAHIVSLFDSLKDKEVKVFVTDIKKEDTSDFLNAKETWTVKLEDENRVRHNLTFDVPRVVDDRFLIIDGNKKNIVNQLLMNPVVKTSKDTVQVTSATYNKIFISRFSNKVSTDTEKMIKVIPLARGISYRKGNSLLSNKEYKTTLEYDSIAELYNNINISVDLKISFDINHNMNTYDMSKDKSFTDINKYVPIGQYKDEVIYLDSGSSEVSSRKSIKPINLIDFLLEEIAKKDPKFIDSFNSASAPTKYMYSRAVIMARNVPLVFILAYCEGLSTTMKKSDIKFDFYEKRPTMTPEDKRTKTIVRFKDGYLVFEKYPLSNSLLLNGLLTVDLKEINFYDMDERSTYVDIFYDMYGDRELLNPLEAFYNNFICPITKESLLDLDLPTDYVSLLIYANKLLEDNDYVEEGNLYNYRLRSGEIIVDILYKEIAVAYSKYLATHTNNNPKKISIDKAAVTKKLLALKSVEDYSTLNPNLELERVLACSYKGPVGLNLEQAYTIEKRGFHKSFMGAIAESSPPSGSVGMTRYLTLDPKLISAKGFFEDRNLDDLKESNLFMPSELLTYGVGIHDDSNRKFMNTGQSKHVVPVAHSDLPMIGNGSEKVIPFIIGDDFCFKAKDDGIIKSIEDDLMIIEYKNGKSDIVDLSTRMEKNSGSGTYISNLLETDYKVGQKFKKNEILAYNKNYFSRDIDGDIVKKEGTLLNCAIVNTKETFEDSNMISARASKLMSTEINNKTNIVLDKYSKVSSIVKIGEKVKANDPILVFEKGFDEDISNYLKSLDDENKDFITTLTNNRIVSKYTATVKDIEIYFACEYDEMDKSLQKIHDDYEKRFKKRINTVKKVDKSKLPDLRFPTFKKIEAKDGKIKGVEVGDGVLIQITTGFDAPLANGDKSTSHTALKGITCLVPKEGDEPFAESRPDVPVDLLLGCRSVFARMVDSITKSMPANKGLLYLGETVYRIMHGDDTVFKEIEMKYLKSELKKFDK